jgi:3-deoxy-manno-octulosonate cytidylyltransferase (CMP-KDO synthetase)
MNNKALGVIPARFSSSRFPGKPLVMIDGKSMVMRVYEQALKSKALAMVIVATDNEQIYAHVKESGGEVMMTSELHISGTSRLGEVVSKISPEGKCPYDVIVNIQGDEPFIDPLQINLVVSMFSNPEVQIGTLIKEITDSDNIFNPNVVKVVVDKSGKAMYFSRSPIPFIRGLAPEQWINKHSYYRHIGMYAFRADVFSSLISLPESAYEVAESLEQLRWLHHGYSIQTALTDIETVGIDTPDDLLKLTNNV